MNKHTPGPWQVAPFSDTDELLSIVSDYEELPGDRKSANWIAECDAGIDFDSDVDEQLARNIANAHLIAAAPELLEALKALRIDANRLCDRNLGGTYEDDCRRSLALAEAAIAKAEGRS